MIVCFWLDILIFISVFFGNKFNLTCDFLVSFQLDLIAVLHEWSWILLFIYLFLGGFCLQFVITWLQWKSLGIRPLFLLKVSWSNRYRQLKWQRKCINKQINNEICLCFVRLKKILANILEYWILKFTHISICIVLKNPISAELYPRSRYFSLLWRLENQCSLTIDLSK